MRGGARCTEAHDGKVAADAQDVVLRQPLVLLEENDEARRHPGPVPVAVAYTEARFADRRLGAMSTQQIVDRKIRVIVDWKIDDA
uniref:Uncharacterized protein n=1 Tax=Mycena chlorophos TaxID=658473 RepID=A0ABQ0KVF0_MYCCL|nr:predicted protein [Mycena chlorophos]